MRYYKCTACSALMIPSAVWARTVLYTRLTNRETLGSRRTGYYCEPCAKVGLAKFGRMREAKRKGGDT